MSATLLAQISDLHIRAAGAPVNNSVDTLRLLDQCVDRINTFEPRPTAVLITGDLTESGADEDYRTLRQSLSRLTVPVYLMPGNHDSRGALRRCFADHRYLFQRASDLAYRIDAAQLGGLQLICLDSLVEGIAHGELDDEQLDWLQAVLAQDPATPTLVAVHHPPFATGIECLDAMGLARGTDRLRQILAAAPNVQRLLSGHLHRPVTSMFGNVLAMTAPSTAHQIDLELRPGRRGSYLMEPPAALLHRLDSKAILVTHTLYIGDFSGPYPFD
jgi:3',5'-cyclic-AMP phosphodiesterase